MWKLLLNFESESVSGRDVEALGVIQFFCEDCFYVLYVGIFFIQGSHLAMSANEATSMDSNF